MLLIRVTCISLRDLRSDLVSGCVSPQLRIKKGGQNDQVVGPLIQVLGPHFGKSASENSDEVSS
jgi:hypothetical protein